MGFNKESKRKKDRHSDSDDYRSERRSKKHRSRSRSPDQEKDRDSRRKRKHSKSKSPVPVKQEKRRDDAPKETEPHTTVPARKPKETDMLNTRTGGAYIPPARLRMMQAQLTDKSSPAYQRLAWEALKKSIHGHINKINVGNIGIIIKELLKENIVRGRGLLCRSVIQAQAASPTFTNVYAALVAAVNSRFPNIGELLLKRLVIQFKRGFKRNDKPICISSASFIAHLVNQRVAHEILALELLTLLVETPTDDSVEVAIAFLKECGQKLTEVSSKGVNAIFEMLRNILHEGQLDKRVQYMIEVMFQVWKDGFKDHPAVLEELELVPEEEQFTHLLMLDDATDAQDILNVFKFDDKYEENEEKYKGLSKEILGSDAESGEEGSEEDDSDVSEEREEDKEKPVTIIDNTETNLVALRRTIYLTINSSLDFEECAHKLMKMQLKPGQEIELCHMFLDCCAEQRTYEKFYGLLAQRFCNINRIYISPFEEIFKDSYSTAHRLDTNRLRNVSKFFAHLLFTDSISWEVLECVKLNEEDTTSSSRIYIKILFQELAEYMGLKKLNDRLQDPTLQSAFSGIFPRDNPKNTRFSINFFTSIGLGGLTDELREHLKQLPKNVPAPITEIQLDSDSSSSSSSSSDSTSSSDSGSSDSEEEDSNKKKKGKKGKNGKKKKSNKTPKTPENEESANQTDKTDRWGHDGFYDTYGQGARRNESRPDREGDGNTREMQNPRHNYEERGRYNDSNKNERDRREYLKKDSQEYRRETNRNNRNDFGYRPNNNRGKDIEESDKKRGDKDSGKERNGNKGYEGSTKSRDNRENQDRYSTDARNRQQRIDNDDINDQRRGRERDQDQSNRRRDDCNSRKERHDRNDKYNQEQATRGHDDRNDNSPQRGREVGDYDQLDKNDDRICRNERNNRNDQNHVDRYNQESSKRYDNRNDRTDRIGDTKKYTRGDARKNRDERNVDDKDSRSNRYEDENSRDGRDRDRERNKNSSEDDYIETERYKNSRDIDETSRRQDKDSKYSKRGVDNRKQNRREEKTSNNFISEDEDCDRQRNKNLKLSKKSNKDHEKRKNKNHHKESSESEEDSKNKRRENKKDKSKKKKRDKDNKRKSKQNLKEDADTNNSESDNSEDSTSKGGRYWDTFDIVSKDTSAKLVDGRKSEKVGKYERKRDR